MSTIAKFDSERFQSDAQKYAAYLETPEGRLRLDLTLANVQEFLPPPQAKHSSRVLDVGGGTGAIAVRLTRLGLHVTLLDSSQAMLDLAKRAAQDADITEKIALKHGDADKLADLFDARSFDVILCHNILEYVDNPVVVLQECARLMRDSSAILSVLVRNQAGEVLKAAIQAGDLAAAEKNLSSEWAEESLYGGAVRLFTQDALHVMVKSASLKAIAERGVRVVSDYLPSKLPRNAEYGRIFELESKLGRRPEFAAVARYTHCLARCAGPVMKDGA
jgi:ubiquinone/menaquinone biosynthesis C-methylase UbiE